MLVQPKGRNFVGEYSCDCCGNPLTGSKTCRNWRQRSVDAGLSTNKIDDEEIMNVRTHSGSSGRYCSRVRSLREALPRNVRLSFVPCFLQRRAVSRLKLSNPEIMGKRNPFFSIASVINLWPSKASNVQEIAVGSEHGVCHDKADSLVPVDEGVIIARDSINADASSIRLL